MPFDQGFTKCECFMTLLKNEEEKLIKNWADVEAGMNSDEELKFERKNFINGRGVWTETRDISRVKSTLPMF